MSKSQIFLVDDDQAYARMVQTLLSFQSRQVTVHTDAETAASAIRSDSPGLVVLDLHVGHRYAGKDVLAQLRAEEETRTIPVILCSGDMELNTMSLDERTDRLPKPFDPEEFLSKVDLWLSQS